MMTKLKTVLTLLLAAVMLLGLCACGGNDTATADPTPTAQVTPEPTEPIFTVRADDVPYYTAPLSGYEYTAGTVNTGTVVKYMATEGDYIQVALPTGHVGWIHSWYLVSDDPIIERQKVVNFVKSRMQSDTFVPIEGEPVYTCLGNVVNCRTLPGSAGVILMQIQFGDEVRVIGADKGYYLVYLENGDAVYCSAEYLEEQATYVELDGAIDLRVFMPGAEFSLAFATENNAAGKALMPKVALLEASTAKMLMEAYTIFREDGYTLKIYDAYHPQSAHSALKAVDAAETGSEHQYGRAVDIYLVNSYTGKELEMPTDMYEFDGSAARDNHTAWTPNARANIAYITEVMTSVGFKVSQTNWWHFENPNAEGKMNIELDWDSLTYIPVSEYVGGEPSGADATPVDSKQATD